MLKHHILLPPWLAYPYIERYSIGWRMGAGEDYILRWAEWYDTLGEEGQTEYQKLFPEPLTWKGYFQEEDELEVFCHGDLMIEFWRENGDPKYSTDWLKSVVSSGQQPDYLFFWGARQTHGAPTRHCLSQWSKSNFQSMNQTYCCMEQFMMAAKAQLFGDQERHSQILATTDPNAMKRLGRKVRNFDDSIWDRVKYSIVLNGNYCKFHQVPALRDFLLSTGDRVLVEASPYDKIWGIQLGESDERAKHPSAWQGQNLLGFALMEVRDELRRIWKHAHLCDGGAAQTGHK